MKRQRAFVLYASDHCLDMKVASTPLWITITFSSFPASWSSIHGNDSLYLTMCREKPRHKGKDLPETAFNQGYYSRFFRQGRKLGRGAYGSVYLCQHVIDNVPLGEYAVKIVPVGDDKSWLERHLREVHILERLRHPNIIEYKHTWMETHRPSKFGPAVPCLFILMEYANGGNLEDYLNLECIDTEGTPSARKKAVAASAPALLDESTVLKVFLATAKGLQHLHALGILHRDLKPANLLLNYPHDSITNPTVLLSDFGECAEAGQGRNTRTGATGTIEFMAPELFMTNGEGEYTHPHSASTDMWSLGMILFYLYFGRLPYKNSEDVEALEEEMTSLLQIEIPETAQNMASPMRQLLAHLLNLDWHKRPKLKEVIKAVEAMLMITAGSPQMQSYTSPPLRAIASDPVTNRRPLPFNKLWMTRILSGLSLLYIFVKCYPRTCSVSVLLMLLIFAFTTYKRSSFMVQWGISAVLIAMAMASRSFNLCACAPLT